MAKTHFTACFLAFLALILLVTPSLAIVLGVEIGEQDGGVRIVSVQPKSCADQLGMKGGDILVWINKQKIATFKDFDKAINEETVTFSFIWTRGNTWYKNHLLQVRAGVIIKILPPQTSKTPLTPE